MANTVIQLKKSAVPNEIPSNLANGELAINYADGKLFYKDAFGAIQQISSGGNTFSTINAAGTLLVSDLPTDILNIVAGDNIEISADALTDTFTITANLSNVSGAASVTTSDTAPVSPSDGDLWYNTTIGKMLVYYDDGSSSQWVEATTGQLYTDSIITSGAFSKANDSYALAQTAFDRANTSNDVLFVVGAYDTANAAFDKANAANLLACTAFDSANSKVSSVTGTVGEIFSSGGTTPTLNLITTGVSSSIYGGATQIPVVNIDAYGRITSASNVSVQGMDYAYVNSSIDVANAYSRVFANSVGSAANAYAASLTPDLSPVFLVANASFDKANAANVLAKAAFDKANTASTNTFATINVAGQIDVTATSATETIVLSTDGTINITTNSTTKTVTFALANTEDYGLITGAVTLSDDYGSIA